MTFHTELLKNFEILTKKPENYLSVQNDIADDLKKFLKSLYDYTKNVEEEQSLNALPELIINQFDEEQIWQEIELQNEDKNSKFVKDVSHLVAAKNGLTFPVDQLHGGGEPSDGESVNSDAGNDDRTAVVESEDSDIPEDFAAKGASKSRHSKKKMKGKPSIVDDRFFKLNELEDYLMREDRRHNKAKKAKPHTSRESSESDSDDESFDYFQDVPSEDDEEDKEELHYADFFDAPEDVSDEEHDRNGNDNISEEVYEDGSIENESIHEKNSKKRVRFESVHSENTEESESGDNSDSTSLKGSKASEVKSSFESRQERLKSKIDDLEAKALREKPWQLKGEVTATTRPQNSLLEEALEFDLTTRPAPIITEQTTLKLEDVIRQRIKDKSWDDVERKVKPVETPFEYKKKLVLNQEKSKLSLAEVYEQEYLKQREALNPDAEDKPEEEPELHKEIKQMMSSLFLKLDALSNFHHTPKPVAPDIQIVNNLPAITIEEVAPVGTSDAALLAPEEVKAKKKGELMGKAERTETDKKRERRRKKARQRERHLEQEKRKKVVEKLRPGLGNKYSKEKAMQALKKAAKDSNVSLLEEKTKAIKSSKTFFSQLQEEVDVSIKSKFKSVKKKKNERTVSAKKLKL